MVMRQSPRVFSINVKKNAVNTQILDESRPIKSENLDSKVRD